MLLRLLTALACVLCIFALAPAFAQKDFRPGYVVKDGDTIRGWVAYGKKSAFKGALFKSKKRERPRIYTTAEASAYGFPGDKQYVAIDIGTPGRPEKVFAMALQKGEIDLYYSKEKYLLFKENKLTVLDRKPDSIVQKKKKGEAQSGFVRDIRFVQELNMLIASDCGLNANSTQFSRNQISTLIEKYNKCRKNYIEIKNTKPAFTIGANLSAGVYSSTLDVTESPGYILKADMGLVWQLEAEIKMPRIYDRVSLSFGFQPIKSTYRGTHTIVSTTQTRQDDLTLKVNYFKIPISFKYNFGNPANSVFLRLGAWQGKLDKDVKFTSLRTTTDHATSSSTTSEFQMVGFPFRNPAGGFIGVGYDKNVKGRLRIFGEVRYERNSGFIGLIAYPSSSFDFIHALVGIGF